MYDKIAADFVCIIVLAMLVGIGLALLIPMLWDWLRPIIHMWTA